MIKFDFDNRIEFEKMWEIISGCVEMYVLYIDHLQDRRTPHLSLEDFLKNYNKDLYDTYTYYGDFAYNIRRLNEEICLPTEEEVRIPVTDATEQITSGVVSYTHGNVYQASTPPTCTSTSVSYATEPTYDSGEGNTGNEVT